MWESLLVIFVCSYLAFSLSAICGGGAGLILLPILGALLPLNLIPAALSIGTFTSSASRTLAFKKNIRWSIVKYFVPAALPAVTLGAFFLKFINPIYLEILMGIFLISNIPLVFKKPKEPEKAKLLSRFRLILIGLAAGFLSGLTGAVGLLFNKFYLQQGLTKEEIIATRAANEVTLHLIKIILYSLLGLISVKVVSVGIAVALSALLSTWTMKYLLPYLSEFVFQKIGYVSMVASGFLLLAQTYSTLMFTNKGSLSANPISKGIETKLQWQNASYALEFTYDEGFEFEQRISFNALSSDRQKLVLENKAPTDQVVIEEVYEIGHKSYEAYYFNNNKLRTKIDFD